MKEKKLRRAKKSCTAYLTTTQKRDGGFESLVFNKNFSKTRSIRTIFIPSLIACCLKASESAEALAIAKRAADFIKKQQSKRGSWNYFPKKDGQKHYPDDLDDTSLALSAILNAGMGEKARGELLGKFANLLIHNEAEVGGPYYTWIVPENLRSRFEDIDPGVNANIAFLLGQNGIRLPKLQEFMEKCIERRFFGSLYYHSPLSILYFFSRSYEGKRKKEAVKLLKASRKKDDVLSEALFASALLHFTKSTKGAEKAIRRLIESSLKKNWGISPFYIEENKEETMHSGSQALSAAFTLEALELFTKISEEEKIGMKSKKNGKTASLSDEILKRSMACLSPLSRDGRMIIEAEIEKVTNKNKESEVMLLPFHFAQALKEKSRVGKDLLIDLGAANLLGWAGYRIFDDILDNEGEVENLTLGSFLARESSSLYEKHSGDAWPCLQRLFAKLDEANRLDRKTSLLKIRNGKIRIDEIPKGSNTEILSYKSIGHAFGPLTVLFSLGFKEESDQIQNTLAFFKHYLLAREMNDDAHDWFSDLQRGFVSRIGRDILIRYARESKKDAIHLAKEKPALEKAFWTKNIQAVSNSILREIKKAEETLGKNPSIEDPRYLLNLLLPLQKAAESALSERNKMMGFLFAYDENP